VITQTQLDQANAVIEVIGGKVYTLASAHVGTRDTEWMRRACAFQCVWMAAQPDMYTRLEMEAISATGRPVPIRETALVLAPLARKALSRVSWLRSRSLHIRSPFQDGLGAAVLGGPVVDYDDMDGGGW
jgi:hypothetical protein